MSAALPAALPTISATAGRAAKNPEEPLPEPFFADSRALRRNFNRAAATFARSDALHREVGTRMQERLGYIKLDVRAALDLGCATGGALPGLRERYPQVTLTALDFAFEMVRCAVPAPGLLGRLRERVKGARLHAACASMAALPFGHGSFDLVWSNLALHWLDDPALAVREAHRVLRSGGLFMFSTLGPDSLKELRAAWGEADASAGASAAAPAAKWRVKRFIDLHDIGDLLLESGFATPVMDMESIVLTYEQVDKLFDDLGNTGSVNAMLGRPRGLTGKSAWARMRESYERLRGNGRLPATFEVVYGHAWKAPLRKTSGGVEVVRFVERGLRGGLR